MAQAETSSDVTFSQCTRMLFYLMTPNESSFSDVNEVPNYVNKSTPFFFGMVLLEVFVGWLKTGDLLLKINDGTTSLASGIISRLPHLFVRSLEMSSYIYVWNNYHILELPWDSAWTWWLAFLGVDFGYYWVHRFSHELNILWAAHQVHHSSEYYNLTTALRQSVTQQCASWVFYLPMALIVPPSVFAVHIQFNLLYQFWIHTEIVRDLGPLEWILNTPSHHRVHHGRNLYCIDRNYGGALIIWDRLFGTFTLEGDKVVYGLTRPINTFEILSVQFHYYSYLWEKFLQADGIGHKLSIIFKGPSWSPGKPRLGDHAEVPIVTGEEVPHNPKWAPLLQAYVQIQFLLVLVVFNNLFTTQHLLSQMTILLVTGYILLTLTSLGYIIDQRPNAAAWETFRCMMMMALLRFGYVSPVVSQLALATDVFVSFSALFWGVQCVSQLTNKEKSH
ncbi:alkylglycerol monooxygenase [Hoplias malabaricus]|uniref:alkylglycerol monooxygenase n=1 Tax=Hoplias malabaricus TaxID=27720 RepID=UPI003461C189